MALGDEKNFIPNHEALKNTRDLKCLTSSTEKHTLMEKTWKKVLIIKDICLHSIKQNALDTCYNTFTNSLTVT